MREEERTRRERGEYARRRLKGPHPRKPQHEGDANHRASRVAPFLLPTTRKNARRSILIVPDTPVDATTPALARFYRRVRSTARRSRHLSPPTHTSFWWSFLFIQREIRESPKHRDERKKEAPRQLATFARRRNHLLSRVRKETDEKTTRELLENARLCGHRARRERERERVTERAYLSSNSWTKCEELFFPPKKTQKKKLQQKKGAFCVQFRVLKRQRGDPLTSNASTFCRRVVV